MFKKQCIWLMIALGLFPITSHTMQIQLELTREKEKFITIPVNTSTISIQQQQAKHSFVHSCAIKAQAALVRVIKNTQFAQMCAVTKHYIGLVQKIPQVVLCAVRNCCIITLTHLSNIHQTCLNSRQTLLKAMGFKTSVQDNLIDHNKDLPADLVTQYYENESRIQQAEFLINVEKRLFRIIDAEKQAYELEIKSAEANYKNQAKDTQSYPFLEAEVTKLQSFLQSREVLTTFWNKFKEKLMRSELCSAETIAIFEQMLPSDANIIQACQNELTRLEPIVAYAKQCREQHLGITHVTPPSENSMLQVQTVQTTHAPAQQHRDRTAPLLDANRIHAIKVNLSDDERKKLTAEENSIWKSYHNAIGTRWEQYWADKLADVQKKLYGTHHSFARNVELNNIYAQSLEPSSSPSRFSKAINALSNFISGIKYHQFDRSDTNAESVFQPGSPEQMACTVIGEVAFKLLKSLAADEHIQQGSSFCWELNPTLDVFLEVSQKSPEQFTNNTTFIKEAASSLGLGTLFHKLEQSIKRYVITGNYAQEANRYNAYTYVESKKELSHAEIRTDINRLLTEREKDLQALEQLKHLNTKVDNDIHQLTEDMRTCQTLQDRYSLSHERINLEIVKYDILLRQLQVQGKITFCEDIITIFQDKVYGHEIDQAHKVNLITNVFVATAMGTYGFVQDLRNQGQFHNQRLHDFQNNPRYISMGQPINNQHTGIIQRMREWEQAHSLGTVDSTIAQCENTHYNVLTEPLFVKTKTFAFLENKSTQLQSFIENNLAKDQAEAARAVERISAIQTTIATEGQQNSFAIPVDVKKLLAESGHNVPQTLTGNAFQQQLCGEIGIVARQLDSLASSNDGNVQFYVDITKKFTSEAFDANQKGNIEQAAYYTDQAHFWGTVGQIAYGATKGAAKGAVSFITSRITTPLTLARIGAQVVLHPVETYQNCQSAINMVCNLTPEQICNVAHKFFDTYKNLPLDQQVEFIVEHGIAFLNPAKFSSKFAMLNRVAPQAQKTISTVSQAFKAVADTTGDFVGRIDYLPIKCPTSKELYHHVFRTWVNKRKNLVGGHMPRKQPGLIDQVVKGPNAHGIKEVLLKKGKFESAPKTVGPDSWNLVEYTRRLREAYDNITGKQFTRDGVSMLTGIDKSGVTWEMFIELKDSYKLTTGYPKL